MIQISHIEINNLRNLDSVSLDPGPNFNILYGDNGSGKTSFLEAIHYLGLGRSFRTRTPNRIINHTANDYTIFANVYNTDTTIPVGVHRNRAGDNQLRLSGSSSTYGAIAEILPLQLIYPDGHKLLAGGPKYRRQFLDWGVFHVEHGFYNLWLRAQRALKQRNRLLKSTYANKSELEAWNKDLCEVATVIDEARLRYVKELTPMLHNTLEAMELPLDISIEYSRGWDSDQLLSEVLRQSIDKDLQVKYTRYGPHKADLLIKTSNKPAQDILSQGQAKLLIYALRLSQSQLLKKQTNKNSIYLIDDLPAELDPKKRAKLTTILANISAQVFITGIEQESLAPFISTADSKLFHVKQGIITPV